jgi:membrane protein
MVNLLRAEILRLVSDRKVVMLAGLVLLFGFWIASAMSEVLMPYSALDWDNAQRQSNDVQISLEVACGQGGVATDCSSLPASVTVEGFLRPQLSFEQFVITTLGPTTQVGLFALAVLIMVMIGSEFSTGAISTQLTFTPRRAPLLWAKVVAYAICGVCLAAFWTVSMVVLDAFIFLNLRGAEGLTAGASLAAQIGRALLAGLVIAVLTALMTVAVASTVKAGLLISAALVISQFFESSKNLAQIAGLLPTTNALSLVDGEWNRARYNGDGVLSQPLMHLDYGYSLGYAAFWLVVFGIWAFVSFSRRNIIK